METTTRTQVYVRACWWNMINGLSLDETAAINEALTKDNYEDEVRAAVLSIIPDAEIEFEWGESSRVAVDTEDYRLESRVKFAIIRVWELGEFWVDA